MKKRIVLVILVMALSLLTLPETGYAEGLELGRRFGLGIYSSVMNLGIGPSVEFWLTNHLGILGTIGIVGDFRSYTVRGNFLFASPDRYAEVSISPYIGGGYTHIQLGDFEDTNDSGVEICGGLMVGLVEHFYMRGEVGYATITFSDDELGDTSWSTFTIGGGVSYVF